MKSRINKLSATLKRSQAFFISNPSDIFYLSGFSGTFAVIIIFNNKAVFVTDPRYGAAVKKTEIQKHYEIVITKNFRSDLTKLTSRIKTILLGNATSLQDYLFLKASKQVLLSGLIMDMRMIKNKDEVLLIKKAVSINEAALNHIVSILRPGVSEKDLALEFEYFARKHGADSLSFEPIIAYGVNSAVPHHKTSGTKLTKNTLILADTGVRYKGYCSDLTRCICFGIIHNRLTDIQKHYNIVKNAKNTASKYYLSGAFIRQADAKARICLKKQGNLDRFFTHSLGHGMGIDIHEPPAVNAKEKSRFLPGMVLSCEPGIYIEGNYGIRIEDDYLITKSGPKKLGKLSDELIITD